MATRKTSRPADSADLSVGLHQAAYYHWQGRGGPHGSALEDWLYAEHLILDAASEPAAESVGPGAESKVENVGSDAVTESKVESAGPDHPTKTKAKGDLQAVAAPAKAKKAPEAAVARKKVENEPEFAPAKPKKKAIPKVKKSVAT